MEYPNHHKWACKEARGQKPLNPALFNPKITLTGRDSSPVKPPIVQQTHEPLASLTTLLFGYSS